MKIYFSKEKKFKTFFLHGLKSYTTTSKCLSFVCTIPTPRYCTKHYASVAFHELGLHWNIWRAFLYHEWQNISIAEALFLPIQRWKDSG